MNSILFGTVIAALLLAVVALIVGTVALALIVGVKNSTHQVVWQPLDPKKEEVDPFTDDEEEEIPEVNPNKKIAKPEKNDKEDFADLDDPTVASNNW